MNIWVMTDGRMFVQPGWQSAHSTEPLIEIENNIWISTAGLTMVHLKQQPLLVQIANWLKQQLQGWGLK